MDELSVINLHIVPYDGSGGIVMKYRIFYGADVTTNTLNGLSTNYLNEDTKESLPILPAKKPLHFPVIIPIGKSGISAHFICETLAYFAWVTVTMFTCGEHTA